MSKRKFSVGQRVWSFDENRRVYPKGPGSGFCGPIFSEHYRECKVVAIEGKSYVVTEGSLQRKIGFSKAERMFRTDQEKEDEIYINDNRHKLAEYVRNCRDAEKLRKIQNILAGVGG